MQKVTNVFQPYRELENAIVLHVYRFSKPIVESSFCEEQAPKLDFIIYVLLVKL